MHYRGSQICDAICVLLLEDGVGDSGGTKGDTKGWSECFLEDEIHKLKLEI